MQSLIYRPAAGAGQHAKETGQQGIQFLMFRLYFSVKKPVPVSAKKINYFAKIAQASDSVVFLCSKACFTAVLKSFIACCTL